MDVVLAADGQKSEPSTYCYGSDEQGAIVLSGVVADISEGSTREYEVNLKAGLRRSKTVEV